MNESIRLGRIAGVAVGINWSLLAIFGLLTVSLAAGRFPAVAPERSDAAYVVAALAAATIFFVSVLAHEVSHAVVAARNGLEVDGIVLWLFGGVARLGGDADSPGAAFRIAAVGPLVSIILGGGFLAVAYGLDGAGGDELVVESAFWLGLINVVLAVFNLFPGAPLDGGRVLRSILWAVTGDKHRSWVQAARAGRVVGFVVIGLGILQFAAIGAGGLWLVLIGWFLLMAANAEEAHARLQGGVGDTRIAEVMSEHPVTAPGDITVEEFLQRYVFEHRFSTFPITSNGHEVVGLATVNGVKDVPRSERSTTPLIDVATPRERVPTARADEMLADVVDHFEGAENGRVLVMDDAELVGIVSPVDVMRLLELRELVGTGGSGQAALSSR